MQERYKDFKFDFKRNSMENIKDHIDSVENSKEVKEENIRAVKNKLVECSKPENLQKYTTFLSKLKNKMQSLK